MLNLATSFAYDFLAATVLSLGSVALGLIIAWLMVMPAWGHTAPRGWAYGFECCSNNDCREVTNAEVAETPQGYLVKASNTLIPYNDRRIKQSGDEFFHVCTWQGKADGRVLCVYVPNRGF